MEGLLEGLGDVLRLVAVSGETLVRIEITAPSSFGMFFDATLGWGHSVLRCSVWGLWDSSLPKCTRHRPPLVCENSVTSISRGPRTSCFLLSTMCGIHSPHGLANSHTVFCMPHRPREGGR